MVLGGDRSMLTVGQEMVLHDLKKEWTLTHLSTRQYFFDDTFSLDGVNTQILHSKKPSNSRSPRTAQTDRVRDSVTTPANNLAARLAMWNATSFWRSLERLSTVAVLVVATVVLVNHFNRSRSPAPPPVTLPSDPISLDASTTIGGREARAGMIIFSDFQCPYCASFAQKSWPELKRVYVDTGLISVSFRHLPLQEIHSEAFKAAEIAECAARQDFFWETHDRLFAALGERQTASPKLNAAFISELQTQFHLEPRQFQGCLESDAAETVRSHMREAENLGVRSTPVFFVGNITPEGKLRVKEMLRGARPLQEFKQSLDRALRHSD